MIRIYAKNKDDNNWKLKVDENGLLKYNPIEYYNLTKPSSDAPFKVLNKDKYGINNLFYKKDPNEKLVGINRDEDYLKEFFDLNNIE